MEIVNLTPHPLVIRRGDKEETIPSSGVARCSAAETEIGSLDGIPVVRTDYGAVVGLPGRKGGTVYVVSTITAQAVVGRDDVYVPARPVRDEQGRIIACAALGRI